METPHAHDPAAAGTWRDDVELVRRARSGDPVAVDEFLTRMSCVRRFHAQRNDQLGSPLGKHELEDVLQETLFALWQKLDLYEGSGPLEAWAYRFAYVRLLTRVRMLDLRPRLIDDVREKPPEPQAPPSPDAFRFETLYRILESIEAPDRELIQAKVFDQRTFEEIAEHLDVPVSSVKTRFYRAIARLRTLLAATDEAPLEKREARA